MRKLKEVKQMIQIAQQGWSEIEGEMENDFSAVCGTNVVVKKERLKNLLEDIRLSIESSLMYSRCSLLMKVCKNFLESILAISENLRASYVSPGYVESFYILDTLKMIEYAEER